MSISAWKQRREAKKQANQLKHLQSLKSKTRRPEVIQTEYNQLCSIAGDKQYRMKVLENELEQINSQLRELNQEFLTSQQVYAEDLRKEQEDKKAKQIAAAVNAAEKNVAPPQEQQNAPTSH